MPDDRYRPPRPRRNRPQYSSAAGPRLGREEVEATAWEILPPMRITLRTGDFVCPDPRCGEDHLGLLVPHPKDETHTPNRWVRQVASDGRRASLPRCCGFELAGGDARERSDRVGIIRAKQSKEAVVSDGLVAGGTVRILRDGADHVGQVTSPADGSRVGTRELLAGDYVAVDEAGNSHAFTVDAAHDLAVIPVQGASGSSAVQVHRLGGGCVDVVPAESRSESPKAASKPRARKPAAKKKAAKR